MLEIGNIGVCFGCGWIIYFDDNTIENRLIVSQPNEKYMNSFVSK